MSMEYEYKIHITKKLFQSKIPMGLIAFQYLWILAFHMLAR